MRSFTEFIPSLHSGQALNSVKGYCISITHYSEQKFLNAFRTDLAHSIDHIIILSPFLSQNRAIHYYPILHSLTARQVIIDVYARPRQEQPENLRAQYGAVERGLKRAGVRFYIRPGMHEKVGIIDQRILWHGSLNILSHNDTRESMLRIESPALVQEIVADLGLIPSSYPSDGYEAPYPMVAEENPLTYESISEEAPRCPLCGQAMLRFENASMWICKESSQCQGTLPLEAPVAETHVAEEKKTGQRFGLSCPLCASPLEISQGVFLRVACTSPACGFALDPRLSAGIVRVLHQRNTL